jgi:hypothetical protein
MANVDQVTMLRRSVREWNDWSRQQKGAVISREKAVSEDETEIVVTHELPFAAELSGADLSGADLLEAELVGADLADADLHGSSLCKANLSRANLRGANLRGADLTATDVILTQLDGAKLPQANLTGARLIMTSLAGADLTGATVFGIAAWGILTDEKTQQTNLLITHEEEPSVFVDNIEVAQFVYLLLQNKKLRDVIHTVTRKGVLLLGRFGDGGLELLQAIAAWLRAPENGGYLPLLFDFPRPESKTYTETVRTLSGLARFVIVDLSGPSVPQEITATVDLYGIPFVPILEESRHDWSMFRDFLVKDQVLEPVRFVNQTQLLEILAERVIAPAEKLIEKRQERLNRVFGSAP